MLHGNLDAMRLEPSKSDSHQGNDAACDVCWDVELGAVCTDCDGTCYVVGESDMLLSWILRCC